jgi:DNA-binding IclR family transcriptional regulator
MTQADNRILETFEDSDLTLSPRILSYNTDYSRHYVARRLSELEERNMVVKVDEGLYEITDRGRAYLAGELDADDLEDSENEE